MEKKTTDFYLCDSYKAQLAARKAEADYTKQEIVDLLKEAREKVRRGDVVFRNSKGEVKPAPAEVLNVFGPLSRTTFYTATKESLAIALAYYQGDKRNVSDEERAFLAGMKDRLADYIAREGVANFSDVQRLCGRDAIRVSGNYWSSRKIRVSSDLSQFDVWCDGEDYWDVTPSDVYVSMSASIAEQWIRKVYPLETDKLPALPGGDDLFMTVDRQNRTADLLTIASTMLQNETIAPASNKLLIKSDLNRFMSLARQGTPGPGDSLTPLGDGNAEQTCDTMALMIALLRDYTIEQFYLSNELAERLKSDSPADMVRSALDLYKYACEIPQMVKLFLPGVVGVAKNTVDSIASKAMIDYIGSRLRTEGKSGTPAWRSVSNLVTEIYIQAAKEGKELLVYRDCRWGKFKVNIDGRSVIIGPELALKHLTFRFIRCYLFYLTAIGVLETAFDKKAAEGTDPCDRMRYYRLTPLGMYAFDLGPAPDLSPGKQFKYRFELVDNPLIVVSLDSNNPYNIWLSRIGVRRGSGWTITPASFLKECQSVADIELNIDEFRSYICAEPPAAWTAFFERLKRNAAPRSLKPAEDNFTVFEINPDNRDLLAFLSNDNDARRLVVRAEGYRIMVKNVELRTFVATLRRGGFLI